MKNIYHLRAIAAQIISQVLDKGRSLSVVLPEVQNHVPDKDKPLLQELCFWHLEGAAKVGALCEAFNDTPVKCQKTSFAFLADGWLISAHLYPHSSTCYFI